MPMPSGRESSTISAASEGTAFSAFGWTSESRRSGVSDESTQAPSATKNTAGSAPRPWWQRRCQQARIMAGLIARRLTL